MTYDKWKTDPDDAPDLPGDEITDEREELYADIDRLRVVNADLLAAAKEAFDAWNHPGTMGTVYSMTRASASLKAAIDKAEAAP